MKIADSGNLRRILIVEDHPLFRDGLSKAIATQRGWQICGEVASAPAAMAFLSQHHVDLALVDLRLEKSHGLELIKDLQVRFPQVRVLVMSLHDESDYGDRALDAGALGYVCKTQGPDVFLQAIRRILDGGTFFSDELRTRRLAQRLKPSSQPVPTGVELLSDREFEVYELTGDGQVTAMIAQQLGITPHTVETLRSRIKVKLGCASTAQLILHAARWFNRSNHSR